MYWTRFVKVFMMTRYSQSTSFNLYQPYSLQCFIANHFQTQINPNSTILAKFKYNNFTNQHELADKAERMWQAYTRAAHWRWRSQHVAPTLTEVFIRHSWVLSLTADIHNWSSTSDAGVSSRQIFNVNNTCLRVAWRVLQQLLWRLNRLTHIHRFPQKSTHINTAQKST